MLRRHTTLLGQPWTHQRALAALTGAFYQGRVGPQYWVVAARAVAALDSRGVVQVYRSANCRVSLIMAVTDLFTKRPFDSLADQHFSRLLSFCFAPHGGQQTNRDAVLETALPTERIVLQMAVLTRAKNANPVSLAMALSNCAHPCGEFGQRFNDDVDVFQMPRYAADTPLMKLAKANGITAEDARPAKFFETLFNHWVARRHANSRDLGDAVFAVNEIGRVLRALSSAMSFPAVYGQLDLQRMVDTTMSFAPTVLPILKERGVLKEAVAQDVSKSEQSALRTLPEEPSAERIAMSLQAMAQLQVIERAQSLAMLANVSIVAAATAIALRSIVMARFTPRATKADAAASLRALSDALAKRLDDLRKGTSPADKTTSSDSSVKESVGEGTAATAMGDDSVDTAKFIRRIDRSLSTLKSALGKVVQSSSSPGGQSGEEVSSALTPKRPESSTVAMDPDTTFAVIARLRTITKECLADSSATAPAPSLPESLASLVTVTADAEYAMILSSSEAFTTRTTELLVNASRRTALSLSSQLLWYRFARSVVALGGAVSSLTEGQVRSLCIAIEAEVIRQARTAESGTSCGIGDSYSFALGLLESLSRLPPSHIVTASVRRCSAHILHCLATTKGATATSIGSIPTRALSAAPGFHSPNSETPAAAAGIRLRANAFALSSIARSHYSASRNVDFRADIEPVLLEVILANMKANLTREFDIAAFGTLMFAAPRVGLSMADVSSFIHIAMAKVATPPAPKLVHIEGISKPAPEAAVTDIVRPADRSWMTLGEVVALVDALNMLKCRDRAIMQWVIQLHGSAPALSREDCDAIAAMQKALFAAASESMNAKTGVLSAAFYAAAASSFDFGSERVPCGIIVRGHLQRLRRLVRRCLNPDGNDQAGKTSAEVNSATLLALRHLRAIDFHINSVVPRASLPKPGSMDSDESRQNSDTTAAAAPLIAAAMSAVAPAVPRAAPTPPVGTPLAAPPQPFAQPPPAAAPAPKKSAVDRALSQRQASSSHQVPAASSGETFSRWRAPPVSDGLDRNSQPRTSNRGSPSSSNSASTRNDGGRRNPRDSPPGGQQQRNSSRTANNDQYARGGGGDQHFSETGSSSSAGGRRYLKTDEKRAVLEKTFNDMLGRSSTTAQPAAAATASKKEAPAPAVEASTTDAAPRIVKVVRRAKPVSDE